MEKITPKKSLGQNFLTNKKIAEGIVDQLGDINGRIVVEIGPGMGVLTEIIISRGAQLTSIDLDSRAIEYLSERFSAELKQNFTLLQSDFLEFSIEKFSSEYTDKILVVGNIPYNISSEIFFKLFENSNFIERAVLTVQKEVARRVASGEGSKEYGILSVARALVATSKIAFDISGGSFYPPPKVTSSVIRMDFHSDQPAKEEYRRIMQLVRASFSQRRKVMKNSLANYLSSRGINVNDFAETLESQDIRFLRQRAEELSLTDFKILSQIIDNFLNARATS